MGSNLPISHQIKARTDTNYIVIINQYESSLLTLEDDSTTAIPPLTTVYLSGEETATLDVKAEGLCLIMYFKMPPHHFIEKLVESTEKVSSEPHSRKLPHLDLNRHMISYMDIIANVYKFDQDNMLFVDSLFHQFFFTLKNTYTNEQIGRFFAKAASGKDIKFRSKVMNNYKPSIRAKTLAEDCGYGYSAFCSKFKSEYGMNVGAWIKNRTIDDMICFLADADAPLETIADRLNMSSVQQLSRFCASNLGTTPSKLRNMEVSKDKEPFYDLLRSHSQTDSAPED